VIVGLAPGLQGANRTGRPFTGDWAGDLLYETLLDFGFARGTYLERPDDGLEMVDLRIINSVRCVPPQNKPTGAEIKTCRRFLRAEFAAMPAVRAAVTLGRIGHDSFVTALGHRPSAVRFGHGAEHQVDGLRLFASYHCSRYNTNTGRLTRDMFRAVFARARAYLDGLGAG
jgi:uracil-DNA glycosylase family 4